MWNDEYITEIEYSPLYIPELSPVHLAFVMLLAGYDMPRPENLSYLELGSGSGVSINIHAATAPGTYWGTDFNPDHAVLANQLGQASGADVALFDASFDELAARDDLPQFDIIALHGIWSWVSPKNRAVIVDIARRKLKPGGLFYVSYNTSPGWSAGAPLRHLMKEYSDSQVAGSIPEKVDRSMEFVQGMIAAEALYFRMNPSVGEKFKALKNKSDKAYLAHEFLNAIWEIVPFADIARTLAEAKLSFASSSKILDLIDSINLSPAAQNILQDIQAPNFRQTVRDYFVNQQFRSDIFTKGAQRLGSRARMERLQAQKFVLVFPVKFSELSLVGPTGPLSLSEAIYQPLLDVLSDNDFQPKSILELSEDKRLSRVTKPNLLEALLILYGLGSVRLVADENPSNSMRQSVLKLNRCIIEKAETRVNLSTLASPFLGGGLTIGDLDLVFIRGLGVGKQNVLQWVFALLKERGQRLTKDGTILRDDEEMLREIQQRFRHFRSSRLPRLRQLGVTDVQA